MIGKVIVVGAGPAGLQAASTLRELGCEVVLVERGQQIGGKLRDWHNLFPAFTPASEVLRPLLGNAERVSIVSGHEVTSVSPMSVTLHSGAKIEGDAVVICTGFDVFPAQRKEEYGYGIYDNVYTSVDVERMLREGSVETKYGSPPQRIAFLHCVGSRDEKAGQSHCSRMCCITGVKQAVELKKLYPDSDIYNFYMDIRMFGPGYEEFYRRAQEEFKIQFIRGRISEAAQTVDRRIQIKAEDTLIGRPIRMTVDMLVLIVGMNAGRSNGEFERCGASVLQPSGFVEPADHFTANVSSGTKGIFYAGTVTGPKSVGECISEGAAAAVKVVEYLKSKAHGDN